MKDQLTEWRRVLEWYAGRRSPEGRLSDSGDMAQKALDMFPLQPAAKVSNVSVDGDRVTGDAELGYTAADDTVNVVVHYRNKPSNESRINYVVRTLESVAFLVRNCDTSVEPILRRAQFMLATVWRVEVLNNRNADKSFATDFWAEVNTRLCVCEEVPAMQKLEARLDESYNVHIAFQPFNSVEIFGMDLKAS